MASQYCEQMQVLEVGGVECDLGLARLARLRHVRPHDSDRRAVDVRLAESTCSEATRRALSIQATDGQPDSVSAAFPAGVAT